MAKTNTLVPADRIERSILFIRGHKVMLDSDLAELYGVTTKRLNEQVKRNRDRFPVDFMFQLTADESKVLRSRYVASDGSGLRSQNATSTRGGRRTRPYAFTEHGAVMLASVLNSSTAVAASVEIVRVFVRLRDMLAAHTELARRLDELEKKYDKQFAAVFEAIRRLMAPPESTTVEIGYHTLVPKR